MSVNPKKLNQQGDAVTDQTVETPGARLDAWLAETQPEHSRARWQALIREQRVTVNDQTVKPNHKLRSGDSVAWSIPEPVEAEPGAEDIPLEILYEDAQMIVINKPAGLVVHPAAGNETGTLVNALLHHCTDLAGIGGEKRPGIVHRLDKDTSGVMVVAKTETAMNHLARQFKDRQTEKEYEAIVRGVPSPPNGTVETTIGRHPVRRKKMAVNVRNGRRAVSHYTVAETFDDADAALVRVKIETGRTHQIRVHMAHIKHPVIGDSVYGRAFGIHASRQMLHAVHLSIAHPDSGERMTFRAPRPQDMDDLLEELRAQQSADVSLTRSRHAPERF
jgi:23S rRNA pseudouridine1911/1915/1917 synthase